LPTIIGEAKSMASICNFEALQTHGRVVATGR